MAIDIQAIPQLARDEQAMGRDENPVQAGVRAAILRLYTALPGIVDSFDAKKQTVKVRPAIRTIYSPDAYAGLGQPEYRDINVIVDVPVVFPGCGDYALTFPVKQGDEVLLVFAQRSIDYWFDRGGVQDQSDERDHHAADAIAIVGLRSQPNVLDDFDEENVQLRSSDGETVITLDQNGKVTIEADDIKLDGDVEITGDLKGKGEAVFSDDVTGRGKSLATHIHSDPQGGVTGPPQ